MTSPASRSNLCPNPAAAVAAAPEWRVGSGTATLTRLTNVAGLERTTAVRATCGAAGRYSANVRGYDLGGDQGQLNPAPAQTVTVSMWVRLSTVRSPRLQIQWYTAAGGYIAATQIDPSGLIAGQWARVQVTGVAPANTGRCEAVINDMAGVLGDTMDATQVLVEVADGPAGTWFDGSTINGAWLGAVGQSQSTVGAQPSDPLLWEDELETGDVTVGFLNNNPGDNEPPNGTTIVSSPVRDGSAAMQASITATTTQSSSGQQRAEREPRLRDLVPGDDVWFADSIRLREDFPTNPGAFQVITQWKNQGTGSPPIALHVEGGRWNLQGGFGYPGGPRSMAAQDLGPATVGVWVDWLFRIRFETGPDAGLISVWRDGTPLLVDFQPPGGTLYPRTEGPSSYWKIGLYRGVTGSLPAVVVHDRMRAGLTRQSVEVTDGPPPPLQVIAPSTIPAPPPPGRPRVDYDGVIRPGTIPAPANPGRPRLVQIVGPADTISAPPPPGRAELVQVISPPTVPPPPPPGRPTIGRGARTPLRVDFWAIGDSDDYIPLPDVATWDLSPVNGSPGAVQITYPADGRNFAVLRESVTTDRDLEIAVWLDGQDVGSLRALLNTSDGDDVAESAVWTFTGNFLPVRMEEACVAPRTVVVQPPQGTAPTTDLSAFRVYAATAGTVMATLMQEAQGRGTLTDIVWFFNNAVDSFGVPWSNTSTLKIAPGTTHLKVLETLVGADLCEWDVVWNGEARELVMWNSGTRGVDHAEKDQPLILRRAKDLSDSPRKHSVRDAGTHLLLAGGEGLYQVFGDPTALARRGRRIERFNSQGSYTDPGSLAAFGAAKLPSVTTGVMEVGHGVALEPGGPRPLIDYLVGDWVLSDTGRGLERLRIAQLTVSGDADGIISAGLSLNDLIADDVEALNRRIDGIEGGSTVTGTSNPPRDPNDVDTMPPAAPQGVVVTSFAQPSAEQVPRSAVTAQWGEVTTNADQTAIDDLAAYIVQWRYLNPDLVRNWRQLAPVDGETANWSGVVAGEAIEVRVAAVDTTGNQGDWSTPSGFHTTETDNTPPPVPSALVVTQFLGTLTAEWDGLGEAGETMPRDFDEADMYRSESNNFGDAVLVESLAGPGARNFTDLPTDVEQFFWLVTVDRTGNTSEPSQVASATPRLIGFGDIAFTQVGNLVEDGSFEQAGSRATHLARSDPAWTMVEGAPGDPADHGDWFARATASVGSGPRNLRLSPQVQITPGQRLAYRLAVRGSGVNGNLSARILFVRADGTTTDLALGFTPVDATGAWIAKEVANYTAPSDTVYFQVIVALEAGCTTGRWDVDRVEVREIVSTLLVQDAAINDAKIANASVGKLTAGTITAIMLMAGMLRSALTGLRYELDQNGLRFYDAAGNITINLDRQTASAMLTGTFQSGRAGRRILIDGGGNRIRMMPQSGETRFGELSSYIPSNFPNDIAVQLKASDADTLDVVSRINVLPNFCSMGVQDQDDTTRSWSRFYADRNQIASELYSSPGNRSTDITLTPGLISLSTRRVQQDRSTWIYGFDDGSGGLSCQMRAGFVEDGQVGQVIVNQSGYSHIGTVDGSLRWGTEYQGSQGLLNLRTNLAVQVVSPAGNAFRPIRASAFEVNSGAETKEAFEALPASALSVLRGAPITRWRYRDDDDPHIGPVAEDLPAWTKIPRHGPVTDVEFVPGPPLIDADGNEDRGPDQIREVTSELPDSDAIDLTTMVGLLWDAVRELDAELDEMRRSRGRSVPPRRLVGELLNDIRSGRLRDLRDRQ